MLVSFGLKKTQHTTGAKGGKKSVRIDTKRAQVVTNTKSQTWRCEMPNLEEIVMIPVEVTKEAIKAVLNALAGK
jgi:hypothetical protein